MALLEVKHLSVALETPHGTLELISDVEFSLEAGETLGMVGESGCGKSMTALAIMSLLPPHAKIQGQVLFHGDDLTLKKEAHLQNIRGNRIAMIFQEPMTALNPLKTIGNQVAEGLKLHLGLNKKAATQKTQSLLEQVGLPPSRFPLNLYPHQLSGGQRQRVMIALAIACEPDILIADEPTTALDVTVQENILHLLNEIVERTHMGLLMISHDLGIIAQTTEKVMVMYAGKTVESGTTVEVFQQMSHPYTYGLFASFPHSRAKPALGLPSRLYSIPGQVPAADARPIGCNFATRCFKVSEQCRTTAPAFKMLTPKHQVACHHPLFKEELDG